MKITASLIALLVLFFVAIPQAVHAENASRNPDCSRHPHQRSVAEVLEAHLAAFQSGDAELLACDYAKNAALILPGSVADGRANIQAAFGSFFALAGGNIHVTTHSLTISDDIALFEYSVASNHVVVTDGVDSLVIDNGLIVAHTARLGGLSVK